MSKHKLNKAQKETDELFTKIAQEQLLVQTLEERGVDRLDFHDVSVIGIRDALQAAYDAGKASLLPILEEAAHWNKNDLLAIDEDSPTTLRALTGRQGVLRKAIRQAKAKGAK